MKIRMLKFVSGYVHGGIRLPTAGQTVEVDDDTGRMLVDSGNAEPVGNPAPVETASAEPAATETATKKTTPRRRKTTG